MKDRRLTQKQIERLLANNPHKNPIELAFEVGVNPPEQRLVSFQNTDKNYDTLNTEEKIKEFTNFIRNVIARYEENQRRQEEAETMEMDLEHAIELAPKLVEKEKKLLYTKLTEVLQTRRACKTENEILQSLYDYFKDKTLLNKLSQLQGTTSSVKDIVTNRTYSCRTSILDDFRVDSLV